MRRTFTELDTAMSFALGWRARSRHAASVRYAVLVLLAACGAAATTGPGATARHNKTVGEIAGLARDHDSGDPLALVEIRLRGHHIDGLHTTSDDHGHYDLGQLSPGSYQLSAQFAGQPLEVANIDVKAGETTYIDLVFTLGRPDPIHVDYGDPKESQIDRYRPPHLGATVARIEGTVNDTSTKERVPGAVVTAVTMRPDHVPQTEQTVSDDDGRFRFDGLVPGTYAVSAYYSIGGRGQVEVRRSEIAVAGAEAVIVPLWIELVR